MNVADKNTDEVTADVAGEQSMTFGDIIGFEVAHAGDGRAVLKLAVKPMHCNRYGNLNGGVVLSLADTAGLWAGASHDGELRGAATVSLTCNFLARVEGGEVRAEASVTKAGGKLFFSDINIFDVPHARLIATASGVYAYASPKPSSATATAK